MVHSGSASPMKTTPSASPHLTAPATAPPPLVPPHGNTTNQDLTPAKLLTTDLTSNSVLTQPSNLTPVEPELPVVTSASALATNSSRVSSCSSTQTPTTTEGQVNGRTSGRKRTPKACDCCGSTGTGHNVRTLGRGKGRGRGRGLGRDVRDTPKRKVEGLLTRIKCFDLTTENVEEADDEVDCYEKVQTTLVVADTQSQMDVALPVTVSLQDEPLRIYVAPEKRDAQKMEDMLIEGSGGKGGGDGRDVEMILSGIAGKGAPVAGGRGGGKMVGALSASQMDVEGGVKKGGFVISSKMDAHAPLVFMQSHRQNKDADMDHGGQTDTSSVKSSFENGDTVNLSDTEPEEDTKEGNMTVREMANGLLSISRQSGASRSGSAQDLDSDMQVDKTHDRTDLTSLPVTLSNGNVPTAENTDHCSTLMEVETSRPAVVAPPFQGPVTVVSMKYSWALRDHRLYCQPGTWVGMEEVSTNGRELDGEKQDKERLEQLTDMIHEFLESFYMKYGSFIPLTESDVLEYLKKKGNSDPSKELDIKREMARYRAGLASAPIAGFMVSYNKHTLGLEDLGTLEEQNWLNDQIINMYGELIMETTQHKVHFFNSFFHKQLVAKGYDGVKRWTKKVDLFSKWLLLFPIHLEIHWSLITVTMATKTISYYDSQGIVFRHTTDNIMKYLQSEAREKQQAAFQKGWKITIIKGIPQQKNDSDCGVFVLESGGHAAYPQENPQGAV
ncbi:uncharacterized protein LOC117729789 isoform X2 [Cyclopterus lumpus]|uniref:uncharacterized protein LOC117729789 isoform X2 n=1 Tax=Cyclopterus lumpus TaxID=8103 RepID=UPI001486469A|nr:uncharacterized protein LOC117729789 isoform X2 [Cyclopterus lumpus]